MKWAITVKMSSVFRRSPLTLWSLVHPSFENFHPQLIWNLMAHEIGITVLLENLTVSKGEFKFRDSVIYEGNKQEGTRKRRKGQDLCQIIYTLICIFDSTGHLPDLICVAQHMYQSSLKECAIGLVISCLSSIHLHIPPYWLFQWMTYWSVMIK